MRFSIRVVISVAFLVVCHAADAASAQRSWCPEAFGLTIADASSAERMR
jgi:hypothetical protein